MQRSIEKALVRVVIPNVEQIDFNDISKAEALHGKLDSQNEEEKLMHSVVEHDDNVIDDGKLISDAINQGFSSFTPDMMFDSLVKDFSISQNMFGERMIRLITGYDSDYIKKNVKIPEFQRQLKENISRKIEQLGDDGLLDQKGKITEKAVSLASLVLYAEELDKMLPAGFQGERFQKRKLNDGDRDEDKRWVSSDRYKDISIRKSIRNAIRRSSDSLSPENLVVQRRISKGSVEIVYCIDSSGSMKGKKIEAAKKAGISLAFHMISKHDKVGLLSFGTEVIERVDPTLDFSRLLYRIASIRASKETNMTLALKEAFDMFTTVKVTKHIILLTDAMPTIGKDPQKEVLETVSTLRNHGISVSLIGIKLDSKGLDFAQNLVDIGNGKLYSLKDVSGIDKVIIEDYHTL